MDWKKIMKDWMLPIAMVTGASMYGLYHVLPEPVRQAGPFLSDLIGVLQPLLIFAMLFLTLCRIEPKDLKPHRWHWWLLLIQGGLFAGLGFLAKGLMEWCPGTYHDKLVLIESAMLCFICPTATAAAVVTRKLGGDVAGITTYTVLVNLLAAVVVPLIVPMLHPVAGVDFWTAFSVILAKIFPLLILPCLAAWMVRYLAPRLHRKLLRYPDLPFYLWAVALTLAIAVTTKSIVQSTMSISILLLIALVSLVCCVSQFAMGRSVGSCYRPKVWKIATDLRPRNDVPTALGNKRMNASCGDEQFSVNAVEMHGRQIRKVTAGQSLGQKNTVFAIWMGYTFMIPETAIVGGFYCIWHNLYNSWQLYRAGK